MNQKEILYEEMKQAKEKGYIHISFSEFSLFNQCGHRHLIQKYLGIDEEPPSVHLYFGDAVHTAIEMTFQENFSLEKRISFFKDRFTQNMFENMKDSQEYKELNMFVEQGIAILNSLNIEELILDYEVISVEEGLYENLYSIFYFKGFIDIVLKHRKTGRYLVVDWKTSTEPWKLKYKMQDEIFKMQMKLYKYFWAKKNNIELDLIDTRYIVLNRFKDKKKPKLGYGEVQVVDISSTKEEIKYAIEAVARTVKSIHINQSFPKAKFIKDFYDNLSKDMDGNYLLDNSPCKFCKYKGSVHPYCNDFPDQDKTFLKEYHKII